MSNFTRVLCRDVRVNFFAFLEPKDQASLRAVSKDSSMDFNHAAQRGYVAVVVCDEYVEDANEIHKDGEDGHPKLHFGPGDRKNLFPGWDYNCKMQRSEKDKNATLIVNVAKMLGKGQTKLQDNFLLRAQFKAVHFINTEALEGIATHCLYNAQNLVCITMSTPCPKLRNVGDQWLTDCTSLSITNFSGCTALQRVGDNWLNGCKSLENVAFDGCSALTTVGSWWLTDCGGLRAAVFSALVSLDSIDKGCLHDCPLLKVADFSGCSSLKEVGDFWMSRCRALTIVNLERCGLLQTVGDDWLDECPSLRRVVLPETHKLPPSVVQVVKHFS